jgi:arylsulfatase A-like enzyme
VPTRSSDDRVRHRHPLTAPRCAALASVLALVPAFAGCTPTPVGPPPSILLFVLDTVRADAVSAYGQVRGTTPATDALAAAGLRYGRAYAQAPWTLPSHATLFTGLLPSAHGACWRRTWADDDLVMLAERLRDAGYETVGASENPWISRDFNMAQGFEHFTDVHARTHDVPAAVAAWIRARSDGRPFFLFVNVIDAHAPYEVRDENPFLPPGVDAAAARAVRQEQGRYLCSRADHARDLAILHGLYLGDVRAADAKLGQVLEALRDAGLAEHLITIVTSDHGEHFGEHRLVSHQFSVREPLLHVPLVVHGLGGVAPAVIDAPVQLADVVPTVLRLARLPVPAGLPGVPLPTSTRAPGAARPIVAEYRDPQDVIPPGESPMGSRLRGLIRFVRLGCTPGDRVFGAMRAVIRYPHKLVWFANYPAELYDLSIDPLERRDLAGTEPVVAATLAAAGDALIAGAAAAALAPPTVAPPEPPPGMLERLRALGYVGDEGTDGAPPAP